MSAVVVLTIVTKKNSFYNSWHNLKSVEETKFKTDNKSMVSLPEGKMLKQSWVELDWFYKRVNLILLNIFTNEIQNW